MTRAPASQPATEADLSELIACPICDALHRLGPVAPGTQARCRRCRSVLMAPRAGALTRITGLALTVVILMGAAVFFPFLDLDAGPVSNAASIFGTAMAYSQGLMAPLSVAVLALIVGLPLLRFAAILYAIGPLVLARPPAAGAMLAFRLAQALKPWAMAEIFIVGVAVSLVKVAGMAQVHLGPAFWAFVALVVVTMLNDTFMCRLSVWRMLEKRGAAG
jgi:paraquat-inducible protein A